MPELHLSTGQSRWQTTLARGGCALFTSPPGIAAASLRQRLLEGGNRTGGGLRWHPAPATGMAVLAPGMTLLSNLQVWENILLPWRFHHTHLPPDAEHQLRRWLPQLVAADDLESWLHRPVGRLNDLDRRAALLLRALLSPSPVVLLTADWLAVLPPERHARWLALLVNEVQTQQRSLLYLADETAPASATFAPLHWIKAQIEAQEFQG